MTGSIGILNVGAGDTKLVFDNSKPDEIAKSAAIVRDMIRRGFVLLVEVGRDEKGPLYRRAHDFDEATAERYAAAGKAGYRTAAEKAPLNHLFGAADLRSVAFRAAQRNARRHQ